MSTCGKAGTISLRIERRFEEESELRFSNNHGVDQRKLCSRHGEYLR